MQKIFIVLFWKPKKRRKYKTKRPTGYRLLKWRLFAKKVKKRKINVTWKLVTGTSKFGR